MEINAMHHQFTCYNLIAKENKEDDCNDNASTHANGAIHFCCTRRIKESNSTNARQSYASTANLISNMDEMELKHNVNGDLCSLCEVMIGARKTNSRAHEHKCEFQNGIPVEKSRKK